MHGEIAPCVRFGRPTMDDVSWVAPALLSSRGPALGALPDAFIIGRPMLETIARRPGCRAIARSALFDVFFAQAVIGQKPPKGSMIVGLKMLAEQVRIMIAGPLLQTITARIVGPARPGQQNDASGGNGNPKQHTTYRRACRGPRAHGRIGPWALLQTVSPNVMPRIDDALSADRVQSQQP